jgi:hypothetical protein
MTEHDKVRMNAALAHDAKKFETEEEEFESLSDAIRGLQSTDDPSLVPLHDRLMLRWRELRVKLGK